MANSIDPIAVAPHIYTLILENERVRVLESIVKVGARAELHHHPNRVVCVTKDARLNLKSPGGEWKEKKFKAGDVFWAPAIDHEAENTGTEDSHNIVIEIK